MVRVPGPLPLFDMVMGWVPLFPGMMLVIIQGVAPLPPITSATGLAAAMGSGSSASAAPKASKPVASLNSFSFIPNTRLEPAVKIQAPLG